MLTLMLEIGSERKWAIIIACIVITGIMNKNLLRRLVRIIVLDNFDPSIIPESIGTFDYD